MADCLNRENGDVVEKVKNRQKRHKKPSKSNARVLLNESSEVATPKGEQGMANLAGNDVDHKPQELETTHLVDNNLDMEIAECNPEQPATISTIEIQNVKKDLYEKSDGTLTINLYIKQSVKDTIKANVQEHELEICFQTTDEKIFASHPNTDETTIFTWSVKLKESVIPNNSVVRCTASTILVTLRKSSPWKKWDSIEASTNPAKVNAVVPNMWVPVLVPGVTVQLAPKIETCETAEKITDPPERLKSLSDDDRKSPLWKKPTCMVNPLKDGAGHVVAPGMTGLANLGNTCFMNSVLQCLVNTREFRDYFLNSTCLLDINTENPLGTGGKLAKKFSSLCRALWDGQHRVFEPSQLKNFIAIKASQFSGYAQHDAHEFMAFLLDGLHEDLNRILNRPYIEAKDWDGRSDEVVANESWDMYRLRNDSIVVDLFQGQYKSKLLCPVCSKVSITFDPFLYLAIPLPKKIRVMPIYFFGKDPCQTPGKFLIKLAQDSTVEDVKEQVYKNTKVLPLNLRVFEVYKNRVHRFLVKGRETICPTDKIFVFEVLSQHSVGEPVNEFTVVQRLVMPMRSTRCSFCLKDSPGGENDLRRCTKCLKASYCDHACQKNHWSTHKDSCSYERELVGLPFIVSLPRSKTTLSKLHEVMEAYARHSVDVFQPPVQLPDNLIVTANTSSGEQIPSLAEQNFADDSGLVSSQSPSFDFSPLRDLQIMRNSGESSERMDEQAGGTTGDGDATDSSVTLPECGSTNVAVTHAECGVTDTAVPNVDCGAARVQVVYGRQRNESKTERPIPMFSIRRVDDNGVTLPDSNGNALEDAGDRPLDLESESFLAMDWRNNEKQQNYVLVQTKELVAQFSHNEDTFKIENNFTLDQCLRLFTEPEVLSPQEAWHCPKCKQHREATKEMSIWKLPTILIVQLKRFSFKNMIWRDKIDKMVEYPTRGLDMSEFYCGPTENEPPPIYDLYATINHHGSILGGHYTSYARLLDNGVTNRSDIDWRLFDDCDVRNTSEMSAMARSAYVLFYRRRGVVFEPSRSPPQSASSELEKSSSSMVDDATVTSKTISHPLDSEITDSSLDSVTSRCSNLFCEPLFGADLEDSLDRPPSEGNF